MRRTSLAILAVCGVLGFGTAAYATDLDDVLQFNAQSSAMRHRAAMPGDITGSIGGGGPVSEETAMTPQEYHEWAWDSCARLYHSFNPQTGNFKGGDGLVHHCQ